MHWSCAGQKDLFNAEGSKNLAEMMERLEETSSAENIENESPFGGGVLQVVKYLPKKSPKSAVSQRSVLKKRSRSKEKDESFYQISKTVTFEMDKFIADSCKDAAERDQAHARLAIQLGARPSKNPSKNYKLLKKERIASKEAQKADTATPVNLKRVKKGSVKKKIKSKK